MSTRTRDPLGSAIGVGSLIGLGVLFAQASGFPSLRVGPAPLVASAIGAVGGLAYCMARGEASERFGSTWDELAQDGEKP